MQRRPGRPTRVVLALAAVFVISGVIDAVLLSGGPFGDRTLARTVTASPPSDFELNWIAAHRLVEREPLYDRDSAHQELVDRVGSESVLAQVEPDTFVSFIGSPVTALAFVPYTPLHVASAVRLYRLIAALQMLGAVVIVAQLVPRGWRLAAGLVGVGACLWSYPVAVSVGLGQVDGTVMLAMAVGMWAATTGRWRVAGVALAIAAVLKISPVLLILYLCFRGSRRVIVPAVVTGLGLCVVAAAVGRPTDLTRWFRSVLPELSHGTLVPQNESLVGWANRLLSGPADWTSAAPGTGPWGVAAWVLAAGGLCLVLIVARGTRLHPLELGAVIVVALVAGPITWDHYLSWAVIPVVLLVDPRLWHSCSAGVRAVAATAMGGALVSFRIETPEGAPGVHSHSLPARLTSGPLTIGLLLLLLCVLLVIGARRTDVNARFEAVEPDGAEARALD